MGPNQSHHYSRVRIFTGNSFSENMPAVQGVWYYCLIGLVCFRFLSPPPFFFRSSVTANKRAHRLISTTCAAHCHCCAFTRQARHCVLWGWVVIVHSVKRAFLLCLLRLLGFPSWTERLSFKTMRAELSPESAQMWEFIYDHTLSHTLTASFAYWSHICKSAAQITA